MILDRIVAHKRTEVAAQKQAIPLHVLKEQMAQQAAPIPFTESLLATTDAVTVIAEVKRASPSKGVIRQDFDPVHIAQTYEEYGARAVSVLTDSRFFQGSLAILRDIRACVTLPLLRKEFIVDSYQIVEARAAGADAILLIVACLTPGELTRFQSESQALGMDVLVEVHDESELEIALDAGASLIGINNRNLRTFDTSLTVTERLASLVPDNVPLVSESGIFTRDDVLRVGAAGARAVLVGESLMRHDDIGKQLQALLGPGGGGTT